AGRSDRRGGRRLSSPDHARQRLRPYGTLVGLGARLHHRAAPAGHRAGVRAGESRHGFRPDSFATAERGGVLAVEPRRPHGGDAAPGGSLWGPGRVEPVGGDAHTDALRSAKKEARMTIASLLATKGNKVVTIRPEQSIREALRVLADHNIGALVAIDPGRRPVGILSERDVVRAAVRDEAVFGLTVSQLMTRDVIV